MVGFQTIVFVRGTLNVRNTAYVFHYNCLYKWPTLAIIDIGDAEKSKDFPSQVKEEVALKP